MSDGLGGGPAVKDSGFHFGFLLLRRWGDAEQAVGIRDPKLWG